ncbi:hypothetical protein CTheo_3730 [Ceratobasidium theobromae]|uniref:DUF6534 domain-containing protein n=1 Tax=Ceratobasidium theobromae TaxID=1582974 RepID=A0A5N5QM21_9AGAM|nr:hypothetical protein CTheo_3730 [Ceratobasidium theobromae]
MNGPHVGDILAAGLATTVGAFIVVDFARFEELRVTICLWLVSSAVADVAITGILTWYLHTHRTGFSRTDDLITRLIRVTVQTGLITTIWAVADLIIFLAVPNPLHLLFNLPLCKLYSNSLMSALNARGGWDENSNEETSIHGMSMPISVVDDKTGDNSQTSLPRKVRLSRRPELNWGGERDSFELTSYTKSPQADVERGEFSTPIVRINSNEDAGLNTAVELTLPAKARSSTGLDTTADEWSLRSPTALEKAECD